MQSSTDSCGSLRPGVHQLRQGLFGPVLHCQVFNVSFEVRHDKQELTTRPARWA